MTMNTTWGFAKDDENWKSTTTLIRNLIDCASKGGNYLLNIGPMANGLIPDASIERLQQIGDWMAVNREAIYGTRASPFRQLPFKGRCTVKGNRLFLHVFEAPADGRLVLPGLSTAVKSAALLAQPGTPVAAMRSEADVVLSWPAGLAVDPHASVIAVELESAPVVDTLPRQREDGSIELVAHDARVTGEGKAAYEHGAERDNIGFWNSVKNQVEWDFRVQKPGRFEVQVIYSAIDTSAGNEFTVSIGEQTVIGRVESTGAWGQFKARKIGTLEVPTAGEHRLVVTPVKLAGEGLMNLRKVQLLPSP